MPNNQATVSSQTTEEVSQQHGEEAAQYAAEKFAEKLRALGYETAGEPLGVLEGG